jgi:hypothetical protein
MLDKLKEKREKVLSWALYDEVNMERLKQLLEEVVGSIREFTQLVRELPLLVEIKTLDSVQVFSGYGTGFTVVKADLIAAGKVDDTNSIFVIEVKERMNKSAVLQAVSYTAGLINTAFSDGHNPRGDIYQLYLEKILSHKNSDILGKLQDEDKEIQIFPVIIGLDNRIRDIPKYRFTKGFTKRANKFGIKINSPKIIQINKEDSVDLIKKLALKKASYLTELHPEIPDLEQILVEEAKKGRVAKFTTTRKGEGRILFYPEGERILKVPTPAVVYDQDIQPLDIFEILQSQRTPKKFFVQFFLNGINNPVYLFEIESNRYLGLEHRKQYMKHLNGVFNEYIAMDAKPLREKPEAGEVLLITNGTYTVKKSNLNGIAIKIKMTPEEPVKLNNKTLNNLHILLLTPKILKAEYNNLVRPYLTNEEAINVLEQAKKEKSQNKIFDYTQEDIPLITTGVTLE